MYSFSPVEAVKASFTGLPVHFVPVLLATLPAYAVIVAILLSMGVSLTATEPAPSSLLLLVLLLPVLAFLTGCQAAAIALDSRWGDLQYGAVMRQAASSILSLIGLFFLLGMILFVALFVVGVAGFISDVLAAVVGISLVVVGFVVYVRATPWLFHIVMGAGVFGGYSRAMASTKGLFWPILGGAILLGIALFVVLLVGNLFAALLGPLGLLVSLVVQAAVGTAALLYSHQVYLLDAEPNTF